MNKMILKKFLHTFISKQFIHVNIHLHMWKYSDIVPLQHQSLNLDEWRWLTCTIHVHVFLKTWLLLTLFRFILKGYADQYKLNSKLLDKVIRNVSNACMFSLNFNKWGGEIRKTAFRGWLHRIFIRMQILEDVAL